MKKNFRNVLTKIYKKLIIAIVSKRDYTFIAFLKFNMGRWPSG